MKRSNADRQQRRGWAQRRPTVLAALWQAAAALALAIVLAAGTSGSTFAATPVPVSTPPADRATAAEREQSSGLVYSLGELAAVDARSITLTFDGGATETYRLTQRTTIQTQNGDTQTVQDLDIGAMVVVISHEDDPTAVTVVNGGDAGFHEPSQADLRGHEQDAPCAPCQTPVGR
ncbi:MAG: hypothetical protein IT306_23520 [Chloroflexi bacterium]|nr:hypothetical protein [Chloroflexota bacterium]